MRLKDSVGWNQLPSDWELYLLASPDGCLVAVCSGQVVGTITAINHAGRCGWIGMVVVDAAFRRLGIATHLMSAALELLRDCRCVKLDATALGLELYTRLGFAEEGVVQRVAGLVAAGLPEPGAEVTKVTAADLDAITQLDTAAFGVSRRALLASLLDLAPQVSWKIEDNSGVCGFCLGRPGQNFFRLGPITAADLRRAQQVTLAALRCLRGRRVVVDIPPGQDAFRAWLEDMGFAVGGEFVRMVRGQSIGGAPARYFAIMGGEFG